MEVLNQHVWHEEGTQGAASKSISSEGPLQSQREISSKMSAFIEDSIAFRKQYMCYFEQSGTVGPVTLYSARPKRASRMREKLVEYKSEGFGWPLTACILDPVRASVVCCGPAQILQVARWFLSSGAETQKLIPCRIKNKFSLPRAQTVPLARVLHLTS